VIASIMNFAKRVGLPMRSEGSDIEQVIHEVTHAVALGITVDRAGLSERVSESVMRLDCWEADDHEALCLASELVSIRKLRLVRAVLKEVSDDLDARDLADLLEHEAEVQGVRRRFDFEVGSEAARELGARVAEEMRRVAGRGGAAYPREQEGSR